MQTILPNSKPPEKLSRRCPGCRRWIVSARDDKGAPTPVEYCIPGKGNLALTGSLVPGDVEPIVVPAERTRFRLHRCPTALPASFSAAAKARKVNAENNYYRYSGPLRRGQK